MPTDPTTPEALAASVARCRELLEQGVVIVDPTRTWLAPDVTIGPGARIWPDTYLLGTTTVASGAEIRPGCWIQDSHIGADALIKPHSVLEGAVVGPRCQVGPMAHLRPGSTLGDGAKVGNFVETKKATLGAGAKASHLTYLGDAEIGEGANIGAGTITCNYDGHGKHRTTVGKGAFIGSNTALVAPIEVGEGAIVGAGSTLTKDVPDHALAVERSDERVLNGYAPRIHARNKRRAGPK